MKITRIRLRNWKNFGNTEAGLCSRTFIVGPNASGKSNFLDVFRFLCDVSNGRLQDAIADRGGMSKIRCLAATKFTNIIIEVDLSDTNDKWTYTLEFGNKGQEKPHVIKEIVKKNDQVIIQRPDGEDKKDKVRLSQTYLEQVSTNAAFREIAGYFQSFRYLHIIPQLIRHSDGINGAGAWDAYGRNFLETIAETKEKTRDSRLKKIEKILTQAVPQLKDLKLDDTKPVKPHLTALYKHWRSNLARQREDQFSDGTLRLIGMLWVLLEDNSLLLLEEPELSLNQGIIEKIPAMMYGVLKDKSTQQVLVSTHSADLLSDKSIGGEEVLLLVPGENGTKIETASNDKQIRALLEGGMSVADAVMPVTKPENLYQMDLTK